MKTIKELKAYLVNTLPHAKIYLFGSRAKNNESLYSDVDIAIQSDKLSTKDFAELKFAIEESNLPYKVDLIDLAKAPYLREIVYKEGVRWQ